MSPTDKTTWTSERINMPVHQRIPVHEFAPKAWSAICELCGGEDRVAPESSTWSDGLIVNLGTPEWENKVPHPKELENWHVDGDFFMHYLDSPEQALLVVPLFTEIKPHGGGTMICPDAIPSIAKHLHDHPEGVLPRMCPRGQKPTHEGLGFYIDIIQKCSVFHELTGNIGDVILMHPFMVHSASRNSLRIPRIITNPPVAVKAPFVFDREDTSEYSLVELKTLQALGVDRLAGWKITVPREGVVPERLKRQNEMKRLEVERLKGLEERKMAMGMA